MSAPRATNSASISRQGISAVARIHLAIDDLKKEQLLDYFTHLLDSHSWSAVKHDLYGLKFFYAHVLRKPWAEFDLVKPPRVRRLPDVLTVEEAGRLFQTTRILSYRVFIFTLYSLGLRIGVGLRLQVGDIDAQRRRVPIRDAKGNKDRFVPLPRPPWICCAVSGGPIATRHSCSLTAWADSRRPPGPPRPWTGAVWGMPCAR